MPGFSYYDNITSWNISVYAPSLQLTSTCLCQFGWVGICVIGVLVFCYWVIDIRRLYAYGHILNWYPCFQCLEIIPVSIRGRRFTVPCYVWLCDEHGVAFWVNTNNLSHMRIDIDVCYMKLLQLTFRYIKLLTPVSKIDRWHRVIHLTLSDLWNDENYYIKVLGCSFKWVYFSAYKITGCTSIRDMDFFQLCVSCLYLV